MEGHTKLLRFHNFDWDEKWAKLGSEDAFEEEVEDGANPAWQAAEDARQQAADAAKKLDGAAAAGAAAAAPAIADIDDDEKKDEKKDEKPARVARRLRKVGVVR
jgi:hypothetical protein